MVNIKDTWQFSNRQAAILRRDALIARLENKEDKEKMTFTINDNITYTSLSDFQSSNSKRLYQDIIRMKSDLTHINEILENTRNRYAEATRSKKYELGRLIIKLEKEVLELDASIKTKEKKLRNIENK